MNRSHSESRRRLLFVTLAMSVAALATGIAIANGYSTDYSLVAFLLFLLIAGISLYQLYSNRESSGT